MDMLLIHDAPVEGSKIVIPKGATVIYRGHVPGGMVRIMHNGQYYVIHPATTKELS